VVLGGARSAFKVGTLISGGGFVIIPLCEAMPRTAIGEQQPVPQRRHAAPGHLWTRRRAPSPTFGALQSVSIASKSSGSGALSRELTYQS